MFFERVSELCKARNITANKLLLDLKFDKSSFSNWKRNGNSPPVDKIARIADYFDVSIDYLLGRTDDPKREPAPGDGGGQAGPPGYDSLNPANKAIVDRLIADLAENQSSP